MINRTNGSHTTPDDFADEFVGQSFDQAREQSPGQYTDLLADSAETEAVAPAKDQTQFAPIENDLYRMRCPHCRKLYSIGTLQLQGANTNPRFNCVACQQKFGARATPEDLAEASTGLLETYPIMGEEPGGDSDRTPNEDRSSGASVERGPIERKPIARSSIEPNSSFRRPAERAPTLAELRCPKCGSRNSLSSSECRYCGVVFAKFAKAKVKNETVDPLLVDLGTNDRRNLEELWSKVMEDYENLASHDRFLAACHAVEALPYASQKYQRILSVSPTEEIAQQMRRKIVAFASYRMEIEPETGNWSFRIPKLNSLAIALASALMVMGFMLPGYKNLAGLGFAMLALLFGVRFFLRPPRY